ACSDRHRHRAVGCNRLRLAPGAAVVMAGACPEPGGRNVRGIARPDDDDRIVGSNGDRCAGVAIGAEARFADIDLLRYAPLLRVRVVGANKEHLGIAGEAGLLDGGNGWPPGGWMGGDIEIDNGTVEDQRALLAASAMALTRLHRRVRNRRGKRRGIGNERLVWPWRAAWVRRCCW